MKQTLRVLFVEDSHDDAELMKLAIESANGFDLITRRVDNEAGFIGVLREYPWDLIICDYHMPTFDAIKALDILDDFALDIPFILVSGKISQEQADHALKRRKVSEYVPKEQMAKLGPLIHRELRASARQEWALQILVDGLGMRDNETEGHSRRVTELTVKLARAMGEHETKIVHYRRGALLHDIGKMGIPDSILLKDGPLTPEEWVQMRKHPVIAYTLLSAQSVEFDFLKYSLDIPHYHHERWDGSGYPAGLKGELIPLPARIFAVCDVYDAITTTRPYREAMEQAEALQYLLDYREILFDPKVVNVFVRMMRAAE